MKATEQDIADIAALRDSDVDSAALFDVLSDPRRRFLIACLDEHSKPMAMADAADALTNRECEMPSEHISDEQVLSRYLALHHVHVPKMADNGIIEYNPARNTIGLRDEYNGITADDDPLLPALFKLREAV